MERTGEFHTLKGYETNLKAELTPAMEDYLEMIARLLLTEDVVRVGILSEHLHVKPSSASKMIHQLSQLDYVDAQPYGYIRLTEKGKQTGNYLLYRHNTIRDFLQILNGTQDVLEEAERIEHFLSVETVDHLWHLIDKLSEASQR